ncbi:MAG: hypothetical protein V1695_00075 [Candidatus Uhrbacteria bacterium]
MSRYFLDEVYYFITVPTVNHNPFFETEKLKYSLLNQIKTAAELHRIKKIDYGILKNHYHFMGYFKNGKVIPSFLRCINGKSSNDVKSILVIPFEFGMNIMYILHQQNKFTNEYEGILSVTRSSTVRWLI